MPVTLFLDNALITLSGLTILQVTFFCAFFCLLASAGGTFNSFIDHTCGFFTKRNILDKYSRQSSQSSIATFLFFLVFLSALIPLPGGENPAAFITPYIAHMAPLPALLFACIIITAICRSKLPNNFFCYLLTLATTLVFIVQIVWWHAQDYTPLKALVYNEEVLPFAERILPSLQFSEHTTFFAVILHSILAAFTIGSIVMMLWLIVRRNWDDFGRDYYTFAMRRAAKRSILFLLLTTAVACYSNWMQYAIQVEGFFAAYGLLLALSALFLVILAALLINICVTPTPMRCKPSAIMALVLYALIFMIQLVIAGFNPSLS